MTETLKARQRLLEESLSDKNLYTDIADDSDLELDNEINKLEEIKEQDLELLRMIRRKEKKTEVLFANLNVHGQTNNIRNSFRERQAVPAMKEGKIDAVKIFSQKLKQQLASDGKNQYTRGQGNVALNIIMKSYNDHNQRFQKDQGETQQNIQKPALRERPKPNPLNLTQSLRPAE